MLPFHMHFLQAIKKKRWVKKNDYVRNVGHPCSCLDKLFGWWKHFTFIPCDRKSTVDRANTLYRKSMVLIFLLTYNVQHRHTHTHRQIRWHFEHGSNVRYNYGPWWMRVCRSHVSWSQWNGLRSPLCSEISRCECLIDCWQDAMNPRSWNDWNSFGIQGI